MTRKRAVIGLALAWGALLLLMGTVGLPAAAQAGTEDAAIFFEELAQYGTWVDYEEYGPVWYPNNVEEDWRPYVNGRWVPTKHGYLFETDEPWGWATYHYGNWMPTEIYGWVWVPGRTWYPSTVTWRSTPETGVVGVAVDSHYIGWAPIPPPNYVPPPNTGWYPPGWAPGQPILNVLTAPFWIFSQAASFLLGLGQPYTPAYTYIGCGCLAPPAYYPVVYPVTRIIPNWYYPTYYPPTYFVGGAVPGAYNWGPPVNYISKVTNINHTVINNYINNYNVTNIRNGYPPDIVFAKHQEVFPRITPPREVHQWGNPMRVQNVNAIINRNQLANPRAIERPPVMPAFDRGRIPKASRQLLADPQGALGPGRGPGMGAVGEGPGRGLGTRGLGLPTRAVRPITPEMEKRLQTAKPLKGAEAFTGLGTGRSFGPGGRTPAMGAVEGQPGMGRGGQLPGAGPQQGIGRGLMEGQPGRGRGPVEGFQKPGGTPGQPGLQRGPEGDPGIRRGPTGPMPEGMPGVRRGPQEGPGVRRGPGEGLMQPPGQGRGPGGPQQQGIGRGRMEGQPGMGPGRGLGPGGAPGGPGQPGIQRGPSGPPPGAIPGGGAPKVKPQPPVAPPPASQGMRGPMGGGAPQIQRGPSGPPPGAQIQRAPGGGAPPKPVTAPSPPPQQKGGQKPPQQQQQPGKRPFPPQ